jgi:hypothetical protein
MKTAITGIVSAVIGGLILLFAQQIWESRQTEGQQKIDFNVVTSELSLSKSELNQVESGIGEYDSGVTFSVISAKNIGTRDLADKSFSIVDSGIIKFGTITDPNSNPKNVATNYDKKVFTIDYRYLPVKGEHKFWLARSYPSASRSEFAPDSPGVITTNSPDLYRSDDFPWFWFGAIAVGVILFVAGAVVNEATVVSTLKQRGYDFEKIKKQPLVADEPELPLSDEPE